MALRAGFCSFEAVGHNTPVGAVARLNEILTALPPPAHHMIATSRAVSEMRPAYNDAGRKRSSRPLRERDPLAVNRQATDRPNGNSDRMRRRWIAGTSALVRVIVRRSLDDLNLVTQALI